MARTTDIPYGAFELKRCYQKNMLVGTLSTAMLAAMIVMAVWLYTMSFTVVELTGGVTGRPDSIVIVLDPLPSIYREPPVVPTVEKMRVDIPEFGIPVPTEAEFVDENAAIPSRRELHRFNSPVVDRGGGERSGNYIYQPAARVIPPPSTFIPHQEEPVLIHEEPPEYPALPLEAGFSAAVYLEVYIDIDGRVKKVHVAGCTRPGMGFEEAAEAAAYKSIYRPAIQNGYAIGIWIGYKVKFVID